MSMGIVGGAVVGGVVNKMLNGGSSGGGSSGGDQTITNIAQPWSGVEGYLKQLYEAAGSQMNQPMSYFPYQGYAGMSPLSQAGMQGLMGYATNVLPGLFSTGQNAIASMLGAPDVANNPYVQNMLGQQASNVTDQLTRNWLPSIRGGAGRAGQFGGSRQGIAEGLAMSEAEKNYLNSAAQTQFNAYQAGLGQQQAGLNFLPQLAQLGMLPSTIFGQVGGMDEAYRQQAIDDAKARYDFAQQEPWTRLQNANAIYSGVPWGNTQTSSAPGTSLAADLLGGGMLGYSLWNKFGGGGSTAWNTPQAANMYSGLGNVMNDGFYYGNVPAATSGTNWFTG